MSYKETNFANKLLAVGTVKQQVAFLQKKVRGNEIDTTVTGNYHLSISQVPHREKADGA